MNVMTGTFTRDTAGVVTLGWQPKAVLIWTAGGITNNVNRLPVGVGSGDARLCVGFAAGTMFSVDQWAAGTAAVTGGGGGRRAMTGRTIVLADDAGAVAQDAELQIDVDGFTINWGGADNGERQILHYLAFGGDDVNAKVTTVTSASAAGLVALTGIGFRPSVAIFATTAPANVGVGSTSMTFGAAVSRRRRFALHMTTAQAAGSTATRHHRNDRCAIQSDLDLDLASMDTDGLTLNQRSATGGIRLGVLCLELPGEVALGSFLKPTGTAPVSGGAPGLFGQPKLVLLASDEDINRANVASVTGARFGLGVYVDGGDQSSSVFSVPTAFTPVAYAARDRTTGAAAFTFDTATPPNLSAVGVASGSGSGFQVTWNPNDAEATEYFYIAIGGTQSPWSGHNIEAELSGVGAGWTNITPDVLVDPNVKLSYGIGGSAPADLVAKVGSCSFTLDNSEYNSGGVRGWYSPDAPASRLAFTTGIRIRYRYRVPGTLQVYTKFLGRLLKPEPTSGIYLQRRSNCDAVDWMNDAADFALELPLQASKRTDEAVRSAVESVTQYPDMDLDVGDSTFPYVFDNSGKASVASELQRLCQSEYGRFYPRGTMSGATVWRFENRSARLTPVAVATFNGDMHGLEVESDIRNVAKVSAHPRTVDSVTTTVLFAKPATSTPSVAPGATLRITGKYSSPSDRTSKVGGTDMTTPVSGTDYVMNSAANGGGTNLTSSFTVVADYRANDVEYTITNTGGTLGYVIVLQARGRGVYDYTQVDAVRSVPASVAKEGEKPIALDMPYQSDFLIADAVAEFIVDTWSTPGYAAARLLFRPRDYAQMDAAMSIEPGDALAISEEMTGINGIYFVQNVEIVAMEESLATFEWDLQRVLVQDYWTLGVSGFSELGVTTILAPL